MAESSDDVLGWDERHRLLKLMGGQKTEYRLVVRARIVWLRLVCRMSVSATAAAAKVTRYTVDFWTKRYLDGKQGLALMGGGR